MTPLQVATFAMHMGSGMLATGVGIVGGVYLSGRIAITAYVGAVCTAIILFGVVLAALWFERRRSEASWRALNAKVGAELEEVRRVDARINANLEALRIAGLLPGLPQPERRLQ